MNIRRRALLVARVFDGLATVVLVVGAVVLVGSVITAFYGYYSYSPGMAFVFAIVAGLAVAIYTALLWASITLATVIAGYIAVRVDLPQPQVGPAPPGPHQQDHPIPPPSSAQSRHSSEVRAPRPAMSREARATASGLVAFALVLVVGVSLAAALR